MKEDILATSSTKNSSSSQAERSQPAESKAILQNGFMGDINITNVDYDKNKHITQYIDEEALSDPFKTAVYFKEENLSYNDLYLKSNQVAYLLIDQGIKRGDIVGVVVDRSTEMIIILLGILKAGAAYLPLDPQYPKSRIDYMLSDSSAAVIICNQKHLSNISGQLLCLIVEEFWTTLPRYSSQPPSISHMASDLAYILYTSGSTGNPKGVMIEHANLANYLLSFQKEPGLTRSDRLLAITTICFDISITEMFLPLITGASVVMVDAFTARDGRELLDVIRQKRVTVMQATPTTWQMILSIGWEEPLPLKVMCGGEPLSKDLAEKLLKRVSELWNVYGPTETTVWSAIKKIENYSDPITVGRPIANTKIYILDENMIPVQTGLPGEIFIAGDGVARGYLNRPELTSEKFTKNPFEGNGSSLMYATGDLGTINETGEIVCLGRIDSQVKIRGHRIELGEIEYNLVQLDGIKEAVVVPSGDNSENLTLIAYIKLDDNRNSSPSLELNCLINNAHEQVKNWRKELNKHLPVYMSPSSFYTLESFPTTNNGKIDRKNLPKPKSSSLTSSENKNSDEFIAPRSITEKIIAIVWSKYLVIESISVNHNFFELGGHSLVAVQVVNSLENETGKKLPISVLFKNPTIEKLAIFMQNSKRNAKDETAYEPEEVENEPASSTEPELIKVPTTEPQKEIWISCVLGQQNANRAYNLSLNEHFVGNFDCNAMKRALQELVNRHQSLRCTFSEEGNEMIIHKHQNLVYNFIDISKLDSEEQKLHLEVQASKDAEYSFNLISGPLFRTSITKLNATEYFLTIHFHHIICDGFSWSILMRELTILYNAFLQNISPNLDSAPSFARYALKRQQHYSTKDYKDVEDYWHDQFKEEVPVLDLPTDFERPKMRTYRGDRLLLHIEPELTNTFKKMAASMGCSTSIALRAAFEILLCALTNQKRVVTGMPVAGQLTESDSNLIGHCVSLLPLASQINTNLNFSEYLQERKAYILRAYDNSDLTFSSLLNKLNFTRDNSRIPLSSVYLNFQSQSDELSFYNLTSRSSLNKKLYETFELAVNAEELQNGISFRWDFNSDLFSKDTIEYFHKQFESIIRQIAKNFQVVVSEIKVSKNNDLLSYPGNDCSLKSVVTLKNELQELIHLDSSVRKPQNEEEEFLLKVWTDVLGLENINIDDDFFELGGYSLLAVQIILAIEKKKGIRLPLATLFENSTIEKLAKIITTSKKNSDWNSLVPIKPTGNKTPIYLVHGLGLNVLHFEPLRKFMDPDQPIYGLQGIKISNQAPSVENIAKQYISEILANDPVGPYAIGGYSFGGLLAYEITKQLTAMGKEVKILAIIDQHVSCHKPNPEQSYNNIKRPIKAILFYTKFLFKYPKNVIGRVSKEISDFSNGINRRPTLEMFSVSPGVNESYTGALNNYKVEPSNVKIELFRCKERGYFLDDGEFYGWREFALKGVTTYDIPGNHKTCFYKGNVEKLSKSLQFALDKA